MGFTIRNFGRERAAPRLSDDWGIFLQRHPVDGIHLVFGQRPVEDIQIGAEMLFRTGFRDDVHPFLYQPSERNVRGRPVMAAGDGRQDGILEDVLLAQWRVSRDDDVVFQAPLEHVALLITRMVLDLIDADRRFRNGKRLPHLLYGKVADADASGLAGVEDRIERADGLFHGHVRGRPVYQEQVHVVHLKKLEILLRLIDGNVVLQVVLTDFGRDEQLRPVDASLFQRFADLALVPVDPGRIEVGVTKLESLFDHPFALFALQRIGAVAHHRHRVTGKQGQGFHVRLRDVGVNTGFNLDSYVFGDVNSNM